MKKTGHLLFLGCFLFFPLICRADDQTTVFQVSLIYPDQLHPQDYNVDGFRFNLFYGVNEDVQGVDLGLINKSLGSVHGYELGLVNRVDYDFGGGQFGLFNLVKRDFKGFQLGLIANVTRRSCEGFQAAVFYNDAGQDMHGLQLGIVNHTGSLNGIQIGIINFNDDTRYLGFFPFINAAF